MGKRIRASLLNVVKTFSDSSLITLLLLMCFVQKLLVLLTVRYASSIICEVVLRLFEGR